MNHIVMKHLMHNPSAMLKFQMMRTLPRTYKIQSPLISFLERISPRDRIRIRGMCVGPSLGYSGSRVFTNAEQALRWCKPDNELVESQSCPSESWRIKNFNKTIGLEELTKCCAIIPDDLDFRK